MRDILRPLSRAWVGIIKKSHDAKSKAFGKDADLCRRFLDGPYDWMYTNQYSSQNGAFQMTSDENIPQTSFRMTTNKVADVVQLYGPSLYARNPHRMVSPKVFSELPFDLMIPPDAPPDDPRIQHAIQMQAQVDQRKLRVREATANVIQDLLNVTPNELDLEWHTRQAIDEALVTGLGCLWIEPYVAPGSRQQFIGSFYDSVDNLLMDPDMEQWKDLLWIARRRVMPRHLVERRYNLKPGTLKGSIESASMQGMIEARSAEYDYYRKRGETTDLSVFWEIYSRMGIGHNLSVGFDTRMRAAQSTLDQFGDHVYLVVSEEFPEGFLNLHEKHAAKEGIQESKKRVSWPTPFYKDPTDPWPCVRYYFHERSQTPWPSSHVKPALGELQFMNWTLSFLADKVKNTSRDFIALLEGAGEDIEAAIMDGVDLTVLKMKRNQGPLKDLIQFLQHPPFNKDIMEVFNLMNREWEQRTGLSMLMYGDSPRQMRSAAEAETKGGQMRIRPDDMARKVEEASTLVARKEMIAGYWHYRPQDVIAMIGQERAMIYQQTVMQQTLDTVVHELDVRIEAGSIRKPNKEREVSNANVAVQVWQGLLQGYAQQTGDFGPINWLGEKWAKANDMEHGFEMQPPPPPQPDEAAIQQQQLEMEFAQQEHQQKMAHKQQEHEQKLGQKVEEGQTKVQMDLFSGQSKIEQDNLQTRSGLIGELQKHSQDMRMDEEKHDQEMDQDEEMHELQMRLARTAARQQAANGNGNGSSGSNSQ